MRPLPGSPGGRAQRRDLASCHRSRLHSSASSPDRSRPQRRPHRSGRPRARGLQGSDAADRFRTRADRSRGLPLPSRARAWSIPLPMPSTTKPTTTASVASCRRTRPTPGGKSEASEIRSRQCAPHACTVVPSSYGWIGTSGLPASDIRRFHGPFHSAAETVLRTVLPARELPAPPIAVGLGRLGWAGVVTTRPHHVGHEPWVRVVTTPSCFGGGSFVGARRHTERGGLSKERSTEGGRSVSGSVVAPGRRAQWGIEGMVSTAGYERGCSVSGRFL